ncbi:MAG TPA: hypothetical protein VLF39_03615 [Candidatus Saccharimonadales bacterium]|nr:hypothetical protein [Candidatus Saccharimonadales bacterium]
MSITKLGQHGDTIVEVLVCIALIGFALSACFSIADNSLTIIRQSEEHNQSLQLAQGQIERFRAWLSINSTKSTTPGPNFFMTKQNFFGFCIFNGTNGSNGLSLFEIQKDPKDPHCAVNQNGQFYCESNPCGAVTDADTDPKGYLYRAGIIYCYANSACAGGVNDQFYGSAGRFAVNGKSSNAQKFDAVSIPFRIHQ